MSILIGILTAIHVLVALFLIVLVLMQKSPEQGVGAAFGGGVTETVFGGGTPTALVRMTIWCASILLGTTLILAVLHSQRTKGESLMQRTLQTAPAPPVQMPLASQPAPQSPESQPLAMPPAPAATDAKPQAPAQPAEESKTP